MQTPSKELESSSMTHEEEEEMLNDISTLQEQVQQVSLAQKGTEAKMDCLKKGVEDKMDDLKTELKTYMDDLKTELKIELKTDMDELKKLLQERVTNGERVVKETHDENKRKMLIMIP